MSESRVLLFGLTCFLLGAALALPAGWLARMAWLERGRW